MKMGLVDKLKQWTNLDTYDDNDDEPTAEPDASSAFTRKNNTAQEPVTYASGKTGKFATINTTPKLQVVLVKPESFDEASGIADYLKQTHTVVLNLEGTNRDTARRLLDFLSGVAYAIQGKIQKVANNTFIIVPFNVGITGDIMDELENNGLYF